MRFAKGLCRSLLGERNKQFRQFFRQALDIVDHGELATKDAANVFVGLRVEADAIAENTLSVKLFHGLTGIFDQDAIILAIDVESTYAYFCNIPMMASTTCW